MLRASSELQGLVISNSKESLITMGYPTVPDYQTRIRIAAERERG